MIPSRNTAAFVAIALAVTACADAPSALDASASIHALHLPASAAAATATPGLLKQVTAATARFHSTVQATKAGYVQASPCISAPPGGMGFHWVNQNLVDPVFDAENPEGLVYAPDKHGNLKLVALEYIVINTGQTAPTFDGQAFDVGGTPVPVAHWSLHVWAHKTNPNGMFAPFNPDVSCTP